MTQGTNAGATGPTSTPEASDLPEMPAEARLVKEGARASGTPTSAGTLLAPPDRELEAAPRALETAAWVLLGGALFPFMDAGGTRLVFLYPGIAKLIGLIGCGMLAASVFVRRREPVPMGLGFLAMIRWGAPAGQKPKNALQGLLGSMPTALHLVGLLLLVAGPVICFLDPQLAQIAANALNNGEKDPTSAMKSAAEVVALLLAGCTLAHIFAYKKGGKFSPLYPFLFAGPAVMGLMSLYTQFAVEKKVNFIVVIGAIVVAVAAAMGLYAIGVAMVQAKKEGDAKREEAMAARRAARKGQSGASRS